MRSASHLTRCTSHSPRFLCARASTSTNRGQRYDTSRHMWWISHELSLLARARITHQCRSQRTRARHVRTRNISATNDRSRVETTFRADDTCAAHAPTTRRRTVGAFPRAATAATAATRAALRGASRPEVACSPEQIRTAVTALRGRRPRPLDDGAEIAFRSSGGRTRTPKDRTRTCCVADYTTPEGGRHRLADAHPVQSKRSRAERSRATARSRPSSSIDSNSGSPW